MQKLDHDLFNKTVKYLDEKKAILDSQEKKDSVFASQSVASTKRQLENTKMILKELYERREAKIIQIALFNSRTGERMADVDALLEEEIKMYNGMVGMFNLYRNGILNNILHSRLPKIEETNSFKNVEEKKEKQNKFVRFLESVPKFVGDDFECCILGISKQSRTSEDMHRIWYTSPFPLQS